ncbi:DegT/DnrJ/EryC1/StrS family aminotransferase [Flavihumibacter petaseus]|uniref:Putative aminotransferase n=1 Tax=Flavihumibacter petaseus NBRC 106054 TaxID=1220578 RepID=A0A0E9MX50_9BACT|nr:DegT/DnrJ/EryC1/StrS family aminotransferase [Flavihumibacter petaseus]GAO41695.1 putative aminotransferase [Flavihumibacter petaseus NBRC 106054]
MPGFERFGEEERKEVNEVLETGILMRYGFDGARKGIWKAKELEAAISDKLNVKYVQLTSSGTAALTTAMAALGIGAGDEVIMPCFTFVASFEAVLSAGATPVLVDIDESLTLDPAAVKAAITPHTKAIMPVHMCGAMADLDALQDICRENDLILLEDACQAIGGSYKGKYLGTIGDAGTFSFDFVKTVTCAEGGAVLTNNESVFIKSDGFSDHGHDHLGADRGADLHPFLGYNFRISELHAAVGLAQWRKLDTFLEIQRNTKKKLKASLQDIPQVSFRKIHDEAGDSATFLEIFLPDQTTAAKAAAAMKASGLPSFYYFDNNWHYFRKWDHFKNGIALSPFAPALRDYLRQYEDKTFPVSDAIINRCICMLINLNWSEEDIADKAYKLKAAIQSAI